MVSIALAAAPPVNTVAPSITGDAEVGSTLTASSGTWTGDPAPTYAYQWQRCEENSTTTTFPLGAGIEPMDIVLDGSGNAYVPDLGTGDPSSNVYKVEIPSGTVTQAGTTDKRPVAIARDSSGNLYTANEGANSGGGNVTKIDTGGSSTNFTVPGASPDPKAIALDSSGNIYVAIYNLDQVAKLLPDGTPAGGNWPVSVGDGPRGIALDSSGNLFVTNRFSNNVSKITPSGVATVSWASTGTGPFGIAIDSSDNVYVANVNSSSVTKITPAGAATTPFAEIGTLPFGIAVDSSGNSYTANPFGNNVSKVTPDGTASILGAVGTLPQDVAVGSGGKIYSADAGGASVTELAPGLNCTDITDATDPTYQLTGDDKGKKIRVKVTGTNGSGSSTANSDVTAEVTATAPVNTVAPSISGTPEVGQTLTGDPGTWTGAPPPDLTYQWQRCDADGTNCVDISGAEGLTYEVTSDDIGKTIKFKVTGTNTEGTADATSDPTEVVPAPPPPPTPSKPSVEPAGGAGSDSLKLKVGCAGSRACTVKITGKLKGGKGKVVPKTVKVKAGKRTTVKVDYTPTLKSELKRKAGGRIAIKAKQVGGATRTLTVKVTLPKSVTG